MRSRSALGALAALAFATNPLPAGGPAYVGLPPPPRVRRATPTPDDLSRIAAAQAKRERRAARNLGRASRGQLLDESGQLLGHVAWVNTPKLPDPASGLGTFEGSL